MPTLKTYLKDKTVSASDIPVGHLAKHSTDGILAIRISSGIVTLPNFNYWPLCSCLSKYIDCGKIEIE